MIDAQTLEFIKSKLDDRRIEIEQFLGQGRVPDFNEYHKLCGVIQGLDFAKQTIADLAKRMETDDDE